MSLPGGVEAPHVVLTLDFPPHQDGGIARWMDELARGLVAAGRPVTVLTRGRAHQDDASHPARIKRLPGHSWVRWHGVYLRAAAPFLGATLNGAVLHAATWSLARTLLDRHADRMVVYLHGLELVDVPNGRLADLRAVLGRAALLVANSQRVAELALALGAPRERVVVLAPCIDPQRLWGEGDSRARFGVEGQPVILTLARLVPRKGQDTVIRALPSIAERVPDVVCVVAGRGPDQPRLQALAAELGVDERVRFVGFIREEDLGAAYRSCAVYAMPCRETTNDIEGFGITFLEAGACSRPVVAGRSGGVEDAVVDGQTGLLVDPEDVGAVADALVRLLLDPALAEAMGQAGLHRVREEFSRAAMVQRLLEWTGSSGAPEHR